MQRLETLANLSDYEWGVDGDVIWIKDLDKGKKSVTNNIDNIIIYLSKLITVEDYMIMYRDSRKIWEEIS
jgi:hypothetical protein